MGNNSKSFISHFIAIGTGTIISMIVGFISTPIITRIVDPEEYGKLSIFQMYTGIAQMVLCLGLDQSLIRFFYIKDDKNYKQSLTRYCLVGPIIVSILASLVVSVLVYSKVVVFEFTPFVMLFLCLNVIISVLNRIVLLLLRVTYQSKKFSISNIINKVSFLIIAVILVYSIRERFFDLLVISTVIAIIISTIYAIFNTKEYLSFNTDYELKNKYEITKYGLPLILSMGITTIFQAIDKISLNNYCTYTEVGVYSSAMTLVHLFSIIQSTFNNLWGPMQMEHYLKAPNDKLYFKRANQMITVVMFALGISLIFIKDIFALVLGSKYREAAYILPFLIFNPIMYTVSETTCGGISFSQKSYWNIVVALGACIVNIIGNIILVPIYSCKGAAISTGISYIVFWGLRTIISNRFYYVPYGLGKFILLTLLTVAYAYYNTFYSFGLLSIILYIVLLIALIGLYLDAIRDILLLFRKFVARRHNTNLE